MDDDEIKEWVSVRYAANGQGAVTVSLVQGRISVKWSEKAYIGRSKQALTLARKRAYEELAVMRTTLAELIAEEAPS